MAWKTFYGFFCNGQRTVKFLLEIVGEGIVGQLVLGHAVHGERRIDFGCLCVLAVLMIDVSNLQVYSDRVVIPS